MNSMTQKVARFGLLTALALVLGLVDRAIPLTALLGGAAPGIKLGLANTVLLYAVYLMDWKSAVLLMLTKVLLSGFLFGSLTAILYSLSGGVLSLAVMLLFRKHPDRGALTGAVLSLGAVIAMMAKNPNLRGQRLWYTVLIAAAFLACVLFYAAIRKGKIRGVPGTSVAGAVAHNIGQVLTAADKETVRDIAVFIGPEGGFSDQEAEDAKAAGARAVTLGKTILRTETAGMAAISMIMYEMEMES